MPLRPPKDAELPLHTRPLTTAIPAPRIALTIYISAAFAKGLLVSEESELRSNLIILPITLKGRALST
ncbi:hypothetical protein COCC4DRAFT_45950 [Bipolaris maydis ATCC 48331]|uniref:Uncharacterized protein n=1 Tax=Cochliobolus heterostrophus (strain C4 / ATCC 48331 / race T) TaxID=665024 RepID=N4WR24_COCH4|nr:uncharacterized protein COCC4DRAFT_45950 [Bipolaris maydis ATCC 48331]ENH98567.1 hypothetical protein COCC4DRAFT_45950 [Bipolaris maydis ATCC 48331]